MEKPAAPYPRAGGVSAMDTLRPLTDAEIADLKKLAREVRGVWNLDEPGIRQAISNTNYNIIAVLIEKTRAVS